jgi:hypothetical protein
MARTFNITTTATDTLKVDDKGHAEAQFTVTNATARPVRGMARAKALGDTTKESLSIAGETERDFGGGATEQFTVNFNAAGAPAGKYPFRLDVASALNPDEDFTEGPTVNVEVAGVAPPVVAPQKSSLKWLIPVIAVVVLLIIGIVVWLLLRNRGPETYTLPDVANAAKDDAKQRLESECKKGSECVTVEISNVSDKTVAKDLAIKTNPEAGTEVPVGSKVTLLISTGPARPKISIPSQTPSKIPGKISEPTPKKSVLKLPTKKPAE